MVHNHWSGGNGGSPPHDRPILYSLGPSGQDNNPRGHASEKGDACPINMEEVGKRKVIWDLCSGLGGWTEAFVQSDWFVIRIDNNPELEYVPFTRIWDVKDWMDWIDDLPHPDIIVASPPCQEFSTANPVSRIDFDPDMSLVQACLDIIDYAEPTYWVLENVKGHVPTSEN